MSDRTDLTWALFTKPWRNLSVGDLADLVARLGFDAVEFPLRPGYQVDLDNLPASLSELSKALADHDLTIAR
jgi:sugar phosphate isomerase/epimerase